MAPDSQCRQSENAGDEVEVHPVVGHCVLLVAEDGQADVGSDAGAGSRAVACAGR